MKQSIVMDRSIRFSRRFLVAAGTGVPLLAVGRSVSARAAEFDGRPDFKATKAGPDRWHWLSWQHDGAYWRPVRGEIGVAGSTLVVRGTLPEADRAAMLDALGAIAAGRRLSFAQES